MRDIKFQVWNRHTNAWHTIDPGVLASDDTPLVQYTGLKDKNGAEIYEGDILEYIYTRDDFVTLIYGSVHIGEIDTSYFGKQSMCTYFKRAWSYYNGEIEVASGADAFTDTFPLHTDWCANAKVIGNVYETPELLKAPNE